MKLPFGETEHPPFFSLILQGIPWKIGGFSRFIFLILHWHVSLPEANFYYEVVIDIGGPFVRTDSYQ